MSDVESNRLERQLFDSAIELSGEERVRFLESACGEDTAMRGRVESLLAAAESSASFLETPAFASDPTLLNLPDPEALLGTKIGRYRLIDVIAEGGMGVVYRAEQEAPARIVAVKVLRWMLNDQTSIDRFHYEVECLGRLRHPGIAQVIEADVYVLETDDGPISLPYFAMEFVPDARPLTTYVREESLDRRQRIELMRSVCDAVHHGHVNGVIHCDLKPANILVDESGRVRIIDFGIARTIERDSSDEASPQRWLRAGTLQYMSPEQCSRGEAIDARADVYSLGVVCYQVLLDAVPYDLLRLPPDEASQRIRELTPKTPSEVDRHVSADLEAVLLKALAKDPADRYSSASELAADLRRYLAHEPVAARPSGAVHQLRLLSKRHRAGFVAAIAILLVVLLATAGAGGFISRLAEQKAATLAQSHRAKAITDFTLDLVNSANPKKGNRAAMTVIDLLGHSFDEIERVFGNEPRTAASLHFLVGSVFQSLNRYDDARAHLTQAWNTYIDLGEDQSIEALWTLAHLASVEGDSGHLPLATTEIKRSIDGVTRLGDKTAIVAQTLWYAIILREAGKLQDALSTLDGIEEMADSLGNNELQYLLWNARGLTLGHMGRYEEQSLALNQALDIAKRVYGEKSHFYAGTKLNLANAQLDFGQYEESLETLRVAKQMFYDIEGENSPQALLAGITETGLLRVLNRFDEAESIGEATLEQIKREYGSDSPYALQLQQNLGQVYMEQGHLDKALKVTREVIARFRDMLGQDHIEYLRARLSEGSILEERKEDAEAVDVYEDVLARATRVLGPEHDITLAAQACLVCSLSNSGQTDEAFRQGEETLARWNDTIGWDNYWTVQLSELLQEIYTKANRPEDAARIRALQEASVRPRTGKK